MLSVIKIELDLLQTGSKVIVHWRIWIVLARLMLKPKLFAYNFKYLILEDTSAGYKCLGSRNAYLQ